MNLDPSPDEMRRLGYAAIDRIVEHYSSLDRQRVATPAVPEELSALVAEPLPRAGRGTDETLNKFFDTILPRATLVNHPRFFAYVPGPGSFIGGLGAACASMTNLFVGTWLGGASMAPFETQTVDWLREALGLPPTFSGLLTSGGSLANLSALAAARARARANGVDLDRARIYFSAETHYSMAKAAGILGFATGQCCAIPVDSEQRIDIEALSHAMSRDTAAGNPPIFVCANAGTTSTGAVDAIDVCADRCAELRAWLHVDGAYGAALALLEEEVRLRDLLTRADSLTLDPHKWLYCPFESGALLTRDIDALHAAFGGDAAYMQDIPKEEVNFFLRGPELSRGNRALKLWTLIRSVGVDAIAENLREDCRRARLACELLASDPRVRIVTPVRMSVFTFALSGGEATGEALVRALIADGTTMLSSSRVDGEFVLRFCVANHRTTDADIERAVDTVRQALDTIGG